MDRLWLLGFGYDVVSDVNDVWVGWLIVLVIVFDFICGCNFVLAV